MKVLGVDIRGIRTDKLEDVLVNKIKNRNYTIFENLREGHNFLLNDNFILGYRTIPLSDDVVMVYMVRDDNKNYDGIYARKKIKIIKAYMDKFLKHKKIVSLVRTDKKEALKLNDYLSDYKTKEPIKLEDNNLYIIYKNYKE